MEQQEAVNYAIIEYDAEVIRFMDTYAELEFESLVSAVTWAVNYELQRNVRYIAVEDNFKRYFSMPVRVIYEFPSQH